MENNSNIHDTNDFDEFNESLKTSSNQFRLPPHSAEFEEIVLHYLTTNEFSNLIYKIKREHFYSEKNQIIFQTILKLYEHKSQIDILLLKYKLIETGNLERIGGLDYLEKIFIPKVKKFTIEEYVAKLSEYQKKRKLIDMTTDISKLAYEETTDGNFLLNFTGRKITELKEER